GRVRLLVDQADQVGPRVLVVAAIDGRLGPLADLLDALDLLRWWRAILVAAAQAQPGAARGLRERKAGRQHPRGHDPPAPHPPRPLPRTRLPAPSNRQSAAPYGNWPRRTMSISNRPRRPDRPPRHPGRNRPGSLSSRGASGRCSTATRLE